MPLNWQLFVLVVLMVRRHQHSWWPGLAKAIAREPPVKDYRYPECSKAATRTISARFGSDLGGTTMMAPHDIASYTLQPQDGAMEWLATVSPTQLPPQARVALCQLVRGGQAAVYRSPHTGEWMVWLAIHSPTTEQMTEVRRTLWQWVSEYLCSQP